MARHPLADTGQLEQGELVLELERAKERIAQLEGQGKSSRLPWVDDLVQHLYDGFALLSPRGVHLEVNPALCAMTGFRREELIGTGIPHPYWPPEERGKLTRILRRHLGEGEGAAEVTFQRKDGGRFPVLITPSAVRDEAGTTVCLLATVKDIGERWRAEAALRESEVRYRTVVENAPVGIFQSTPEGQLLHANPAVARMLGFATPAEMIAVVNRSSLAEALYPDTGERRQLLEDAHQAGGEWISFKAHLRHRDGGVRTVQFYACERRDPLGGQPSLYGFIQDITAEEAAGTALARSMQLLKSGERLAHVGSWEMDVAAGTNVVSEEWQRMHGLEGALQSNAAVEAACHPDDREAVRQAMTEAAGGGTYRVEHRIVRRATRETRHLVAYGDPVFDATGRLERILGASLDVTERVRADAVLREREERLKSTFEATVGALGATVAMRDPYTASHERRVAELACAIASSLGWSQEALERLRIAALVHDIGKITVPAELLAKPTRLSEAEFALIKAHAQAAYDILAPIDFGGPVAEIVQQHHERLDGSGYPRGLKGEEILPGARLLAVTDVVEAMVSHRPYRPALPLETALAEIEGGAGTRYDATAVAACRALFTEGFAFTR